eukprot:TRINITY_DN9029_c0_g1_i1.p2 TRINITY_DN9029_c0_g1~~TRINITY_DN9029_c0_g1_i1.p2  ORF type:complete len:173 (-),score=24.33 TRINITY_DN9029_c0_g1_i1:227-745(-)
MSTAVMPPGSSSKSPSKRPRPTETPAKEAPPSKKQATPSKVARTLSADLEAVASAATAKSPKRTPSVAVTPEAQVVCRDRHRSAAAGVSRALDLCSAANQGGKAFDSPSASSLSEPPTPRRTTPSTVTEPSGQSSKRSPFRDAEEEAEFDRRRSDFERHQRDYFHKIDSTPL